MIPEKLENQLKKFEHQIKDHNTEQKVKTLTEIAKSLSDSKVINSMTEAEVLKCRQRVSRPLMYKVFMGEQISPQLHKVWHKVDPDLVTAPEKQHQELEAQRSGVPFKEPEGLKTSLVTRIPQKLIAAAQNIRKAMGRVKVSFPKTPKQTKSRDKGGIGIEMIVWY